MAIQASPVQTERRVPAVVPVPARWLVAGLLAVTATLLAANVAVKVGTGPSRDLGAWVQAFDVNREMNVPTMWNCILFLLAAATCLLVAILARARRGGWLGATVLVTGMGADEMLRWHERLRGIGARVADVLPFAVPTYAWVVPGLVTAAAVGVAALWWTARLPADVRRGVILGLGTFFTGAIGAEAVSGWVEATHGLALAYTVVTTVEEGLEMLGCIVVTMAVLRMLRSTEVAGGAAILVRSDA